MSTNLEAEIGTYLLFSLGGKLFALAIEKVISIVELQEVVDIPNSPKLLKGVITVRDEVVPVLDIQYKFNQEHSKVTSDTCLVIIDFCNENNEFEAAIQVDNVYEVIELKNTDFKPIPQFNQSSSKEGAITSIVHINDKIYLLIDFDRVFDDNEIFEIDSFVQGLEI